MRCRVSKRWRNSRGIEARLKADLRCRRTCVAGGPALQADLRCRRTCAAGGPALQADLRCRRTCAAGGPALRLRFASLGVSCRPRPRALGAPTIENDRIRCNQLARWGRGRRPALLRGLLGALRGCRRAWRRCRIGGRRRRDGLGGGPYNWSARHRRSHARPPCSPGLAANIQPVKMRLTSPCSVTSSTSTNASVLAVSVAGRV